MAAVEYKEGKCLKGEQNKKNEKECKNNNPAKSFPQMYSRGADTGKINISLN